MWTNPPTQQDIRETAEATHEYFSTGGRWGSVTVYYSMGGRLGSRVKLHLYETDTIQDMKKRATHMQFPLCALYRIDGATAAQYREAIESAVRMKGEGSI